MILAVASPRPQPSQNGTSRRVVLPNPGPNPNPNPKMTRVAAESCDEVVACRLQRTQPQEVFVIETLSRIRLMCAAQQLRLVAEMKRRRARKHHFVAALPMLSLSDHLLKRAMDLREKAAQEAEDAETLCRIAEELEDIADGVFDQPSAQD